METYKHYLTDLKGYSEKTAISYISDLQRFITWARTNVVSPRWSTITINDIDEYIKSRVRAGKKASTTNRELASISSYYNFLKRSGKDIANPCKMESRRKKTRPLPSIIPPPDLQKAYEESTGATKVIIGLLATTGMRISELLQLNWTDINYMTGTIKVRGKGMKERYCYTTREIIETLFSIRKINQAQTKVITLSERQVRHNLWLTLRNYSSAKQLSPHAIRHTYATTLAQRGVNAPTLAKLLGHQRIETSQHYIDMSAIDIESANAHNSIIN